MTTKGSGNRQMGISNLKRPRLSDNRTVN